MLHFLTTGEIRGMELDFGRRFVLTKVEVDIQKCNRLLVNPPPTDLLTIAPTLISTLNA